MKKQLLLGMMLLISGVMLADLTGKFLKVCQEGICYLNKTATDAIKQFDKDTEKFLTDVMNEVNKPMGIEFNKLLTAGQRAKKDVATLKKDIDLLKDQAGEKGTTYNAAVKIDKAADKLGDALKALKKADPAYSYTELTTAITGVPSLIEKLYGGRSKEVKAQFDQIVLSCGVIRDNLPNLDVPTLGIRVQQLIAEVIMIMDDITDMRKATGTIANSFISDSLTQNFRGIRDDLALVTTRLGTLAAYRSYVVGGPLSNVDLASKIGLGILSNVFNANTVGSNIETIHTNIEAIGKTADAIKQNGKDAEALAAELESLAQIKPAIDRIKKQVSAKNILDVNKIALQEVQTTISNMRLKAGKLINLALVMLDQVAGIISRAYAICNAIDKLVGKNFLEPKVLQSLSGLADDIKNIRKQLTAMQLEVQKKVDNF
jgi:hypothetical protein